LSSNTKIRVSSIYRDHFNNYLNDPARSLFINNKHLKAVNKSLACRSAKLGVAVYNCDDCGDTKYIYRSCKHRFCSQCGASDTAKWAEQTLMTLLNIKHHHIIFTLPAPFRFLAKKNGDLIHNLLFKLSAQVLKDWFRIKHNILPGIVSVLHTAGSDLKYHPHIHMIVTGGGLDLTSNQFTVLENDYLTKQRFLANKLKILFKKALLQLHKNNKLIVPKKINHPLKISNWIDQIAQKHWIVSIQNPLDDLQQIVGYVGRYTKRSCISEYKIKENNHRIVFEYNDYKNTPRGHKPLIARKYLKPTQFLDKLLQHVPQAGFKSVRYYGLYSSFYKKQLPKSLKVDIDLDLENDFEDTHYQWGEHEALRKKQIVRGKPDPLHCYCCNKSMKLLYYQYDKKHNIQYEYDSS